MRAYFYRLVQFNFYSVVNTVLNNIMTTRKDDLLDQILLKIGDIGKHQIKVICCLILIILLHSAVHMAYVFTAKDSNHRCLIPECEASTDTNWIKDAIPFKPNKKPFKCLKFERFPNSSNVIIFNENCSSISSIFDANKITRCSSFSFENDDEFYLDREFDLLCEEDQWLLSLVGSFNTFGMFLGLIVTGFISDKYGRKRVLLFGMCGCGLVGLLKTFSPSFLWVLLLEMIEAILSAGTCCCIFIIGVELVIPRRRALMSTIFNTSYSLGEVLIAIVAWATKSWKLLIYYFYTPCVLLIFLYWILPESFRWMLSRGKIEESKNALRQIAKSNHKELSEETLKELDQIDFNCGTKRNNFFDILRSNCLLVRFLNCCFGWITCAFLFYGITLNSVSLHGNKYLDFAMISLTEIPAYWFTNYAIEKFGRRPSICFSYFLTSLSCICFIFSEESSPLISLLVYCLGKFGASAAFTIVYVITSEIFPTTLRHTVMSMCSTIARLGSMTSPQTPLLSEIWTPLPLIMFASMSAIAGTTSLFFPESKGIKLPDTIEEAERIK